MIYKMIGTRSFSFLSYMFSLVFMFQMALSEQWEMYGTVREEQLRVRLRERIHRGALWNGWDTI